MVGPHPHDDDIDVPTRPRRLRRLRRPEHPNALPGCCFCCQPHSLPSYQHSFDHEEVQLREAQALYREEQARYQVELARYERKYDRAYEKYLREYDTWVADYYSNYQSGSRSCMDDCYGYAGGYNNDEPLGEVDFDGPVRLIEDEARR